VLLPATHRVPLALLRSSRSLDGATAGRLIEETVIGMVSSMPSQL
jgi:hypothetical protein